MGAQHGASTGLPRVDGFTIEELIGTGGFSRVYRATQHGLDRPVAVKVLNASFEDDRQQKKFDRECKVMGQLSTHQNIVTVFASAQTADQHPCIIMELCEGTYRAEEQLDIAEVVDVGAKVADALQAIHDRGFVHRDIKPHNIFISAHGEPAIGDFGISSIESERTVTGGAGFSINYAPPEVFEEGGAGAAGDIYALGATLYQLASGEVPFPHTGDPAERMRATVHKIITSAPPTLRRSDSPESLDLLLRHCMAKNAGDRPAHPSDVARALRRIQMQVGPPDKQRRLRIADRPAPTDPSPDQTADRRSRFGDDVTALRDRNKVRSDTEVVERKSAQQEAVQRSHRKVLVGAGLGLALIAVSGLSIALGLTRDDAESGANTTAPTIEANAGFTVLVPPGNLTVERSGDGDYEIAWESTQENVKYQVHHVGSSDSHLVDAVSYNWAFEVDPGSACFEVRTVNSDETRISQSSTGPVCAAD